MQLISTNAEAQTLPFSQLVMVAYHRNRFKMEWDNRPVGMVLVLRFHAAAYEGYSDCTWTIASGLELGVRERLYDSDS